MTSKPHPPFVLHASKLSSPSPFGGTIPAPSPSGTSVTSEFKQSDLSIFQDSRKSSSGWPIDTPSCPSIVWPNQSPMLADGIHHDMSLPPAISEPYLNTGGTSDVVFPQLFREYWGADHQPAVPKSSSSTPDSQCSASSSSWISNNGFIPSVADTTSCRYQSSPLSLQSTSADSSQQLSDMMATLQLLAESSGTIDGTPISNEGGTPNWTIHSSVLSDSWKHHSLGLLDNRPNTPPPPPQGSAFSPLTSTNTFSQEKVISPLKLPFFYRNVEGEGDFGLDSPSFSPSSTDDLTATPLGHLSQTSPPVLTSLWQPAIAFSSSATAIPAVEETTSSCPLVSPFMSLQSQLLTPTAVPPVAPAIASRPQNAPRFQQMSSPQQQTGISDVTRSMKPYASFTTTPSSPSMLQNPFLLEPLSRSMQMASSERSLDAYGYGSRSIAVTLSQSLNCRHETACSCAIPNTTHLVTKQESDIQEYKKHSKMNIYRDVRELPKLGTATKHEPVENPRLKLKLKRHGKYSSDGPTFWGMWEDERSRMVYVSWFPRTARANDRSEKKRCELVLKEFIQVSLGFTGLEKVLLFPPTSAHCKLLFISESAARLFLSVFGGLERDPGPALWKILVCRYFQVDIRNGIHSTRVRIIWADQTKNDAERLGTSHPPSFLAPSPISRCCNQNESVQQYNLRCAVATWMTQKQQQEVPVLHSYRDVRLANNNNHRLPLNRGAKAMLPKMEKDVAISAIPIVINMDPLSLEEHQSHNSCTRRPTAEIMMTSIGDKSFLGIGTLAPNMDITTALTTKNSTLAEDGLANSGTQSIASTRDSYSVLEGTPSNDQITLTTYSDFGTFSPGTNDPFAVYHE